MKDAPDGQGLDELIAALQIFRKYGNPRYPTNCEHDELTICGIEPIDVSTDDRIKLETMGFIPDNEDDIEEAEYFISFRYGSA